MSASRQEKLQQFVDWAGQHITGDEKGQAQVFLDRLFQAFGQKGSLDVGGSPEFRIKKSTEDGGGTSFADYVWKPVVLIEMKKRGVDLTKVYRQAFDYWTRLVPNRPRYVVLCNFDRFDIYDFDKQVDFPVDSVALTDLANRYGPLAFLFPTNEKPVFQNDREKVTREAADRLATCYRKLETRKVDPQLRQRFILQVLVALFSEDIGLLEKYTVTRLVEECKKPSDSYDLLGGLFEAMNRPEGNSGGRYKGVRYFNGGLFAQPARLELHDDELSQLRECGRSDWSKVSPEIFGTIFQHSMEADDRHAFGAHYTSQLDIMKIVKPTIVDPWETAIATARNGKRLNELLERLATLRVLDPACGSGNFLYLAYREMKRLETRIRERLKVDFPKEQPGLAHVNARQFFGMDILPFAIELAKVTMMIARKLAIDELHIADEKDLPLDNLDANLICGDALITNSGIGGPPMSSQTAAPPQERHGRAAHATSIQTAWPPADVIIGNPPFLGAKRLKPERGADYVNAVRKLYGEVPGMADYCVYWIRRAHDHLQVCSKKDPFAGRAGLVGTQNIRNNQSRVGGLDHVVKTGTIIEAVDNQPWSGEANVHVSIANWVKTSPSVVGAVPAASSVATPVPGVSSGSPTQPVNQRTAGTAVATETDAELLIPPRKRLWSKVIPPAGVKKKAVRGKRADKTFELKDRECEFINAALSDETDTTDVPALLCNETPQRVFNGQYPRHAGFRVVETEARQMIADDPRNAEVVHPYLVGAVMLTNNAPDQWVIDFQRRNILEAQRYKLPFEKVQREVLPHIQALAEKELKKSGKKTGQDQNWLQSWWHHFRSRTEMHAAIGDKTRFIACCEVTKRPIFVFVHRDIRPDKTMEAFAFDDDYSFGVLSSNAHWEWFITKCSKLKSDFRYTPESVFDTFPWPQDPSKKQIDAVAAAGREVRKVRESALKSMDGGLRAVYRSLELPGKHPLKDAHAALDAAVMEAYGFDPKADLLKQLLELNKKVAGRIGEELPVTAPGVPPSYGDPTPLITDDCIKP